MPPKGKRASNLSAAMTTNMAEENTESVTTSVHNDVTTSSQTTKKEVKRLRIQRQITIDPELLAQAEAYVFRQKQGGERGMSFSRLVEEAVKKELERIKKPS